MVARSRSPSAGRITAVLGPTNTGKTHLAVERMLGYATGIIGLPLRLLAREIYDLVVGLRGAAAVALVTGEEKIVPANPAYFVCTVEAMPLERSARFVAVDEVQLAADPERGHVFTDRILRARGTEETMLLGADTMRPLIRRLVPEATYVGRPRFSRLAYAGEKKLSRLPPRSAIVAFSAAEVYAIAELVRRQRGGAAVVLGALSPRTRNAQVSLFEAGEVDYLVATDAIGMGLNMNIDHVAFAALRKFDGRAPRALSPAELAQIAGRAGRYMIDGTFGTTADAGRLDPEAVERIEEHRFDTLKTVYWRNTRLDVGSPEALLRSLEAPPPAPLFARAPFADDHLALKALAGDPTVARLARGPAAVKLLWDVCQIPDFRKTMAEAHDRLLGQIYRHLMSPQGTLPTDWMARHVARLDRIDGDIDTLATRIAHVRTWTYVSHRADWLDDARHWQERARAIEDRLSDALHRGLTQRFFDHRTAVLARRLKDGSALVASIAEDGEVLVEGIAVGRLHGLNFQPDPAAASATGRALRTAANRALAKAGGERAAQLVGDDDSAFALAADGRLQWGGAAVARLAAGREALAPRVALLPNDLLDGRSREQVRARLQQWLAAHLAERLAPLFRLHQATLAGPARGLAFALGERLGTAPRRAVQGQLDALDPRCRAKLGRLGVRFGALSLYMPAMLKPDRRDAAALLWRVHHRHSVRPAALPAGAVSVALEAGVPEGLYMAQGFRPTGRRAVRADMLERLGAELGRVARSGSFAATLELLSLVGCPAEDFTEVLAHLGYRPTAPGADGVARYRREKRWPKGRRGEAGLGQERALAANSPFARLRQLDIGVRTKAE